MTSQVSQVIAYDRRNNIIDPTDGYYLTLSTDLAGLGEANATSDGGVGGAFYLPPFEAGFIGSASCRYIVGLDRKLRSISASTRRQFLARFQGLGASPRDAPTFDAAVGWLAPVIRCGCRPPGRERS